MASGGSVTLHSNSPIGHGNERSAIDFTELISRIRERAIERARALEDGKSGPKGHSEDGYHRDVMLTKVPNDVRPGKTRACPTVNDPRPRQRTVFSLGIKPSGGHPWRGARCRCGLRRRSDVAQDFSQS